MPTDVFWTGLFTVGGGVAGGSVGYATARLQHGLQERQLRLEERRHESQESHTGLKREDERREQRRQIYLQYLEALDAILNSASTEAVDQEILHATWGRFMQADSQLELAGTDEIKTASYPLNGLACGLVDEFSSIVDDPARTWPDEATKFMHSKEKKLQAARNGMVSLMRQDLHAADGLVEAAPPTKA